MLSDPDPPTSERRPRGRPRGTRNKPREAIAGARLGYRPNEFCKLAGISRAALTRAIRAKKIKVLWIGRCMIITNSEARRLGFSI